MKINYEESLFLNILGLKKNILIKGKSKIKNLVVNN